MQWTSIVAAILLAIAAVIAWRAIPSTPEHVTDEPKELSKIEQ